MLIPKNGTLERIMFDKLVANKGGVTFLDFIGTGITEENIDSVACNLRNGMFEAENDNEIKFNA